MRSGLWFPVALAVASILSASPAMGQEAQTWVSGTGTDNAPCTRAQPCRTFAGAYAKTATGGQIQVLSSGDFGRVTITKSITIKAEGVLGSIVTTSTGITINARPDARVVIDGLDIDGGGQGFEGVFITGAGEVVVRNTSIRNFRGTGVFLNNYLEPGTINLTLDNVLIHNAQKGLWVTGGAGNLSKAYMWNSKIIDTEVGIYATGVKTRVELSGNVINRTLTSIHTWDGGVISSYGDNILSAGDAPSSVLKK